MKDDNKKEYPGIIICSKTEGKLRTIDSIFSFLDNLFRTEIPDYPKKYESKELKIKFIEKDNLIIVIIRNFMKDYSLYDRILQDLVNIHGFNKLSENGVVVGHFDGEDCFCGGYDYSEETTEALENEKTN